MVVLYNRSTAGQLRRKYVVLSVRNGTVIKASNWDSFVLEMDLNDQSVDHAKHFDVAITYTTLVVTRRQASIDTEAALDGIYVLRTTIGADQVDAPRVVGAYKDLANVERDFRHIKVDDINLRPIHHWLEGRVRSHVFICMLTAYLVWHLREVLAPLTFTDEEPPRRDNPVAPAERSADARTKRQASRTGRTPRSGRFEVSSTTSPH